MKALKAVLIAILITTLGVGAVQADWETRRINDDYDDLMITTTGGIFQTSPWIEVIGGSADLFNYYAFRSISIPNGSIINNAYLEFEAPFPWNYNQSVPVSIYGLKQGDLGSWNPAPALNSYPVTNNVTNWDAYDLISAHKINVTVTGIIQEIYDQFLWYDGNDMGIKISSIAVSGGQRFQVAHDSDSAKALKLYIDWTQGTVSGTEYYKGWTITPLTITGNNTIFKWYDATDASMRMTTDVDGDTLTRNINPNGNWTNAVEVDGICAVGTDIYTVVHAPATPWNVTLFKTSDRGDTWINVGEIESLPQALASSNAYAIAYDQNNSIHIGFTKGFDTWHREFKIHNQSFTAKEMIVDGGYDVGQVRSYWDTENDTIWFTRHGGDPTGSADHAWILRRPDSTKVWELYKYATTEYRDSDVVRADGVMYWAVHQYGAGAASQWLRLFKLTNYTDFTNWTLMGIADPAGYLVTFDMGTWNDDPVVSIETTISGEEFIKSYRWNGATFDGWVYNLTGFFPASQPEFHIPKMYLNNAGNLRMAIVIEQDSGYSLIDKAWVGYQSWEGVPPTTVLKATGHWIYSLGGDYRPFSTGQTGGFSVTKGNQTLNNTCIQNAETIEEVQACIDDFLNDTDPFDPDPPSSNYPDHDSFGRFDIKYYIWIIGQTLIMAPCIAVAYRRFPLVYYPMFVIVVMVGLGLLWSLSGM